jgi:hypothetical protein
VAVPASLPSGVETRDLLVGIGSPVQVAVQAFEAVVRGVGEVVEEGTSVRALLVAVHAGGVVDLLELFLLSEADRRPGEGDESEPQRENPRRGVTDTKAPDHGSHVHAPDHPSRPRSPFRPVRQGLDGGVSGS